MVSTWGAVAGRGREGGVASTHEESGDEGDEQVRGSGGLQQLVAVGMRMRQGY